MNSRMVKLVPIWQKKKGFSEIEFGIEFQILISIYQDQSFKKILLKIRSIYHGSQTRDPQVAHLNFVWSAVI